eukprot:gene3025-5035_t
MKNSHLLLLTLFCLFYFSNAQLDFLYPLNKARRSLPRLTFTFKLAPTTFQPLNLDYWQGIGVLSIFGVIVTIIVLLFFLIFPKVRRCGFLGGMEPSTGWFKKGNPRTKPYPIWLRVLSMLVVAVLLICIAVFCAFGAAASHFFHVYFESGRTTTKTTTNKMYNTTEGIRDNWLTLINVTGTTTQTEYVQITNQLNSLVAGQGELKNVSCTMLRDVGRVNKTRYVVIIIFLVFALLAPIFMLMSGIFHCKGVALWSSKIAMTMGLISLVLFVGHFSGAVVMSDFCSSVDDYVINGNSAALGNTGGNAIFSTATQLLDIISTCNNNGTFIGSLSVLAQSFETNMISSLNSNMKDADPLNEDFHYVAANVSLARNDIALNRMTTNNRNAIIGLIGNCEEFIVISNDFDVLTNCTYIADGFKEIRNAGCIGILASSDLMWIIFIFLAVFEIVVSIVGMYGYKLYRKKKYTNPKPKNEIDKGVDLEIYKGMNDFDNAEVI